MLSPLALDTDWVPGPLTTDEFGTLFLLDLFEGRIFRYSDDGGWTRFDAGAQGGGRFASLRSLRTRGPDLFALDAARATLYRFGLDGRLRSTISLLREETEGLDAVDFLVDKTGELLVLDRAGRALFRYDRDGGFVAELTDGVDAANLFRSPVTMALGRAGNVVVLDGLSRRVFPYERQGDALPSWSYEVAPVKPADTNTNTSTNKDAQKSAATAEEPGSRPRGNRAAHMALLPDGEVVLASAEGDWLRVFAPGGRLIWRKDFAEPEPIGGMTADNRGRLFLSRPNAERVDRMQWDGAEHVPVLGR